eukprot:Nitzschia sp. Nitz4//scaffold256_size27904//11125//14572//NITZ4_008168-RA/size27904-snap-gene-0.11-mRNA-1//-1//CDS//3329544408//2108//frame0
MVVALTPSPLLFWAMGDDRVNKRGRPKTTGEENPFRDYDMQSSNRILSPQHHRHEQQHHHQTPTRRIEEIENVSLPLPLPQESIGNFIGPVLNPFRQRSASASKEESPDSTTSSLSESGMVPNPIHPDRILAVHPTSVAPNPNLLKISERVIEVFQAEKVEGRQRYGESAQDPAAPLQFVSTHHNQHQGQLKSPPANAMSDSATNVYNASQDMDPRHVYHRPGVLETGTFNQAASEAGSSSNKSTAFRDYQSDLWDEKFAELAKFKQEHGHCLVPLSYDQNCPGLNKWIKRQRYQKKLKQAGKPSTLSDHRELQLSRIGFVWESQKLAWEMRFQELVTFKRVHGHCNVPSSHENHKLSVWVQGQRRQYKLLEEDSSRQSSQAMNPERIARLDEIGFTWKPRADQISSSRGRKKRKRCDTEDCDDIDIIYIVDTVPLHLNVDLVSNKDMFLECLGPLLRLNQNQHSGNTNTTSRGSNDVGPSQNDRSVDEVDLTDYQAALWKKRYRELIRFRERHGHCLVPHKWHENLALATWVKRQRYQWKLRQQGKRSTLTTDRLDALSRLGFVWDSHNATWEERFNELVEFKRLHGHTSVPTTYKNHSLSVWVQCQRRQWKLFKEDSQRSSTPNSLKEARVARLDTLGFIWEPRKQRSKTEDY